MRTEFWLVVGINTLPVAKILFVFAFSTKEIVASFEYVLSWDNKRLIILELEVIVLFEVLIPLVVTSVSDSNLPWTFLTTNEVSSVVSRNNSPEAPVDAWVIISPAKEYNGVTEVIIDAFTSTDSIDLTGLPYVDETTPEAPSPPELVSSTYIFDPTP